jgi:hypothetical protein
VGVLAYTQKSTDASALNPSKPPHTPVVPTFQGGNSSYITGSPAIPIHATVSTTDNNASTPAFSAADVTNFLNTNGFFAGPVVNGAHLKILSIQFVTAKQASDFMQGESIGRPDDYLICYVKVQGPFVYEGHAGPPHPNRHTRITADWGEVVFNAHTGNVLVWGIH